jgi:hypothetical protein
MAQSSRLREPTVEMTVLGGNLAISGVAKVEEKADPSIRSG